MSKQIFFCIHGSNQAGGSISRFLAFADLQAADSYVRDWLSHACGLDCYCGEVEEAALRAENGGELPTLSFACPTLQSAADLEGYNGFYYYADGGAIQIFLLLVYDLASAKKFAKAATKEYELDKVESEAADATLEALALLERSFVEEISYGAAVETIDLLIRNEGLPLF